MKMRALEWRPISFTVEGAFRDDLDGIGAALLNALQTLSREMIAAEKSGDKDVVPIRLAIRGLEEIVIELYRFRHTGPARWAAENWPAVLN